MLRLLIGLALVAILFAAIFAPLKLFQFIIIVMVCSVVAVALLLLFVSELFK